MAESPELGKKSTDQDEILRECEVLEGELVALRVSYERYFLGIDRQPPTHVYNSFKKRLLRVKSGFVRQTALKFRIGALHQKFSTYDRLWQRTLQEMENGTYRRDVYKARLHAKKRDHEEAAASPKPSAAGATALPPEDDLESALSALSEMDAPPVAKPPPPPAAAVRPPPPPPGARAAGTPPPPPAGAGAGPLSDAKMRAIFDAYVTAKKRCNEDTSKMDYNSVAATLKKQVPELMKKHNAKSVDFKVVIKDGKAVLRAVPKE